MVSLLGLVSLTGCGISQSVKVVRETVFVHTVAEDGSIIRVGRIGKNVKVPVVITVKDEDGNVVKDKDGKPKTIIKQQDVGGWGVSHPNAMKSPKQKSPAERESNPDE